MSLRKQYNVGLTPELAEKVDALARIFHQGKGATVCGVILIEALRTMDETKYFSILRQSSQPREEPTHGRPNHPKTS